MECCSLTYIPKRLHQNEERHNLIEEFSISDILYRRVKEKDLENPYVTISLTDLSHNIGTNNGYEISKKRDVLFSILESEEIEVYDLEIVTLNIISLNKANRYDKEFFCNKDFNLKVRIVLTHAPVPCMFPHTVFQFFIYEIDEEIEVSYVNYKTTLGQKKYKYLRDKLRHELALMIVREAISYNDWE